MAIELKCGSGHDALGPCAWDALKLAFALQIGEVSAGYLVAGTPADDWTLGHRGTELFETGTVESLALRERFLDWWQRWERRGDPAPAEVPVRFTTQAVAQVPFAVDVGAWELRLAAVAIESGDRIAWPPVLEAPAP